MIAELDTVRLRRSRPEEGLAAGAEGTVVLAYPDGRHYEVEFLDSDGWTTAVCTLSEADVEPMPAEGSGFPDRFVCRP
jgi:hypothetical protein